MKTSTKPVAYPPTRQGGLPASWERAFGILRGSKPDPIKELKRMRKKDDARSKSLERPWKR